MPSSKSRKDWIVREARKRPRAKTSALLDGMRREDFAVRQRIDARFTTIQEPDDTVTTTALGTPQP